MPALSLLPGGGGGHHFRPLAIVALDIAREGLVVLVLDHDDFLELGNLAGLHRVGAFGFERHRVAGVVERALVNPQMPAERIDPCAVEVLLQRVVTQRENAGVGGVQPPRSMKPDS